MMISSAGASSPYAAAAAVSGPSSNSGSSASSDSSSDSSVVASGPDVVVTLGQGSPAASTYDASGKMSGAPTLDDLGANAQDSSTKAAESDGADSADPTSASSASGNSSSNANVDEDAAVAACDTPGRRARPSTRGPAGSSILRGLSLSACQPGRKADRDDRGRLEREPRRRASGLGRGIGLRQRAIQLAVAQSANDDSDEETAKSTRSIRSLAYGNSRTAGNRMTGAAIRRATTSLARSSPRCPTKSSVRIKSKRSRHWVASTRTRSASSPSTRGHCRKSSDSVRRVGRPAGLRKTTCRLAATLCNYLG